MGDKILSDSDLELAEISGLVLCKKLSNVILFLTNRGYYENMRIMEDSCHSCADNSASHYGKRMSWVSAVLPSSPEFRYKPGNIEKVTIFLDLSFFMCKINASAWVVSRLPSQP